MSITSIEELNTQFALHTADSQLDFVVGQGGLPVIEIKNRHAQARIGLQGAYVLSWIPNGQRDVIWVSDDASYAVGKSIRGGIPICWPWFGPHDNNATFPAHGFARTVFWEFISHETLPTGASRILLRLPTENLSAEHQAMWPQKTELQYSVTVGESLQLALTTRNLDQKEMVIGQALHTYFSVGDVRNTVIHGLDGKEYLDKTDQFQRKTQTGPVDITDETDRIYLHTSDALLIDDEKRRIRISKTGSQSTVVWNPWQQVANKMGDLGPDGYLHMLCVESANAAEDTVSIKAGESHTLWVQYEIVDD